MKFILHLAARQIAYTLDLRHPPPNIPNCGTCKRSVNAKMRVFLVKMASFWPKSVQKTGFAVTDWSTG
jgi:hypothetical protein